MSELAGGILGPELALDEWSGAATDRPLYSGESALAHVPLLPADFAYDAGFADLGALSAPPLLSLVVTDLLESAVPTDYGGGVVDDQLGEGAEWWEEIHAVPRFLNLGSVVSTQVKILELFNADRFQSHELSAFDNQVDEGVSIPDLPTLPYELLRLDGLLLSVTITTEGPPFIDGDLVFVFDLYDVVVPVTGTRVLPILYQPEAPVRETLGWLTDIIPHQNGSEQGISVRKCPRQEWVYVYRLTELEQQSLQNLLMEWQAGTFGIPIWVEPSFLSIPISSGATSVTVDQTQYGDFRIDGLAIILSPDQTLYDVLQITVKTDMTLEFATPALHDYPIGSTVMPMRLANARSMISGSRQLVKIVDTEVSFRVTNNDVDLADPSGFSSLDGLVLMDDPNVVESQFAEALHRELVETDNRTGLFKVRSTWAQGRRGSQKGFTSHNRQELSRIRGVLHYLRGRQRSWFLPTFWTDLTPISDLVSGSATLNVSNVGYARYVKNRKSIIRVHRHSTSVPLTRHVVDSEELSATVEQLQLDDDWPETITVADVARIEYIERVRLDSDTVQIIHADALGSAKVRFPVKELVAP